MIGSLQLFIMVNYVYLSFFFLYKNDISIRIWQLVVPLHNLFFKFQHLGWKSGDKPRPVQSLQRQHVDTTSCQTSLCARTHPHTNHTMRVVALSPSSSISLSFLHSQKPLLPLSALRFITAEPIAHPRRPWFGFTEWRSASYSSTWLTLTEVSLVNKKKKRKTRRNLRWGDQNKELKEARRVSAMLTVFWRVGGGGGLLVTRDLFDLVPF